MTGALLDERSRLQGLVATIAAEVERESLPQEEQEYVLALLEAVRIDLERGLLGARRLRPANAVTRTVTRQFPSLAPWQNPSAIGDLLALLCEIYGSLPDGFRWTWQPQQDRAPEEVSLGPGRVICDRLQTWMDGDLRVTLLDGMHTYGSELRPGFYLDVMAAIRQHGWWIVERQSIANDLSVLSQRARTVADDGSLVAVELVPEDEELRDLYDPAKSMWINDRIDLVAFYFGPDQAAGRIQLFLSGLADAARRVREAGAAVSAAELLGILFSVLSGPQRAAFMRDFEHCVTSTWNARFRMWVYSGGPLPCSSS